MKPAIAYGITGSAWATEWEILAITSEKDGRRGMVFGRDEHGNATHHKPTDVRGRFKTLEEAEQARDAIRRIHAHHDPAINDAKTALNLLESARFRAIEAALATVKISKPVMVLEG